jgi:hypothetical protein
VALRLDAKYTASGPVCTSLTMPAIGRALSLPVPLFESTSRPSLGRFDKLFWVIARRAWSDWKQSLILVTPKTIVRWQRSGFRMYWRLISRVRKQVGRRPTPKEVRELILRMVVENPTWGGPRIHGELRMLGFELSARTIPVG